MAAFGKRARAFAGELKRRRVYRTAAWYAATGFVVVQVAQAVFPALQFPAWTYPFVVVLALLGFPVAMVLAWALDVTPAGIVRTTSQASAPAVPTPPAPAAIPAPPGNSIAVLPFADLSAGRDNEYFSDGLTDEIITALSKVRALRVISRTSVMGFKGATRDLRTIAGELGVRHVLEGSVRKAGDSLRVTAQLIEAESDTHVWADSYDGTLEDVFGIQRRLAGSIVGALRVHLTPEEAAACEMPAVDPRIRDAYLRAWHEIWSWAGDAGDNLERARQIAQNAIEAFGEHELLLTAIGTTYWQPVNAGTCPVAEYPNRLRRARDFAERAVALNPRSSAAHVLVGEIHNNTARPLEATLEFHRAARLDSCNADALLWLGFQLGCGGVEDEARCALEAAIQIDPLRAVPAWCHGIAELMAGRHREAVAHARRMTTLENAAYLVESYAFLLGHAGEMEEAARVLEPVFARERASVYEGCLGFALDAFFGRREAALSHLTDEVLAGARWDDLEAWYLADGFAALGERDKAFHWWNRAVDLGVHAPDFLARHDRFLEPLRGEPEFQRILARARAASDALRSAIAREPKLVLQAPVTGSAAGSSSPCRG